MYMSPELLRFLQQVNDYLQYQNQQIQQLNSKLDGLIQEMNQLKQSNDDKQQPPQPQPQPPVIRNEYHFDLLKVEKLEGTLNIGINPNGSDSSIDEMSVGQSVDAPSVTTGPAEQPDPLMYNSIQEQIHDYLRGEAFHALKAFEAEYEYPLDDPYRSFIVNDVKKQIDKRIRYYMSKLKTRPANAEQVASMQQPIIEEVKRDIEKTFEAFIKNLPRKDGNGT
ncbi:spore gernimation protein [Paenibacillus sp. H1-7]|uniref:spore germination protein GerPC n=1 Tax=Paenibacillus sp. H1-7 TaxID=2282849 RepID=UPI001EF86DB2|nr:spore germination protein GerPC [Paenibacillus sp. H1-7]ULL15375.1 spore gernimation protein [Paenibacillus sp. H1-7]